VPFQKGRRPPCWDGVSALAEGGEVFWKGTAAVRFKLGEGKRISFKEEAGCIGKVGGTDKRRKKSANFPQERKERKSSTHPSKGMATKPSYQEPGTRSIEMERKRKVPA